MNFKELQKRIDNGTLETRGFGKVRKLIPATTFEGRDTYEVYVRGIDWCIGTVWADNGKIEDTELNDEDVLLNTKENFVDKHLDKDTFKLLMDELVRVYGSAYCQVDPTDEVQKLLDEYEDTI